MATGPISSLEERVSLVLTYLSERRKTKKRAFSVELAGMANAGKSEFMGNLRHLFYVERAEVQAVTEGAFNLAILQDERENLIQYNLRTLAYALEHLLRHDLRLFDIVIFERSLFDAYCWFTLLRRLGKIDNNEYETVARLLVMRQLRERMDLVMDFIVDPAVAEHREITTRYVKRRSVGTNLQILTALREIHLEAARALRECFRIVQIDTSELTREEVYERGAHEILLAIEAEREPKRFRG